MPIELSPSVQAAPAEFGPRRRIAVIGAGVAGLTAAHVLQRAHDVTLFERNGYFGGHTHTVTIESGQMSRNSKINGARLSRLTTYPPTAQKN